MKLHLSFWKLMSRRPADTSTAVKMSPHSKRKITSKNNITRTVVRFGDALYLELSLGGSRHDHHPHFGVWSLGRGDLQEERGAST